MEAGGIQKVRQPHRAARQGNQPSRRHSARLANLLNAMTVVPLDQHCLDPHCAAAAAPNRATEHLSQDTRFVWCRGAGISPYTFLKTKLPPRRCCWRRRSVSCCQILATFACKAGDATGARIAKGVRVWAHADASLRRKSLSRSCRSSFLCFTGSFYRESARMWHENCHQRPRH